MDIMYRCCAGLDVHKKTVVACRMRSGKRGKVDHETQTFGTTTGELLRLVDWLTQWDVSHVAMESTGEYWKPIFNLLEGNIEVFPDTPGKSLSTRNFPNTSIRLNAFSLTSFTKILAVSYD